MATTVNNNNIESNNRVNNEQGMKHHLQFTKAERMAVKDLAGTYYNKLTRKGGSTHLRFVDMVCLFTHIIDAINHHGMTDKAEIYDHICKDLDYLSEWKGRNYDRKVWDCLISERAYNRIFDSILDAMHSNNEKFGASARWFAIDYIDGKGEKGTLYISADTAGEALEYGRREFYEYFDGEAVAVSFAEWNGEEYVKGDLIGRCTTVNSAITCEGCNRFVALLKYDPTSECKVSTFYLGRREHYQGGILHSEPLYVVKTGERKDVNPRNLFYLLGYHNMTTNPNDHTEDYTEEEKALALEMERTMNKH